MNQETIEDFRQKHFENYKNAVLETLKNNTISLFDDDILSLLKKPPLDSMDVIKCKFLELAKRHKTIIKADVLDKILEDYRKKVITYISDWKKIRITELQKIIISFSPKKETDVIKFNKKDFIPFIISSLLVIFFRNNAIYMYFILAILTFVFFKKYYKQ